MIVPPLPPGSDVCTPWLIQRRHNKTKLKPGDETSALPELRFGGVTEYMNSMYANTKARAQQQLDCLNFPELRLGGVIEDRRLARTSVSKETLWRVSYLPTSGPHFRSTLKFPNYGASRCA